MRPAHQRLEADDRAGREIDERLVVHLELAAASAVAQIDLELAARLHARVHLGLEEAERALAVGLGAVERHIGVLEQLVGVLAVAGRQRDADAGADRRPVPVIM